MINTRNFIKKLSFGGFLSLFSIKSFGFQDKLLKNNLKFKSEMLSFDAFNDTGKADISNYSPPLRQVFNGDEEEIKEKLIEKFKNDINGAIYLAKIGKKWPFMYGGYQEFRVFLKVEKE